MEKEVLATITEEESEQFTELLHKSNAVKKLQESLVEQLSAIMKDNEELWEEIQAKYGISGTLSLNHKTREITQR